MSDAGPFVLAFHSVSIPNPTIVVRKAYFFLVVTRLDVIEGCLLACVIVIAPRGLSSFLLASPVAEKGPFLLLRINPIISRGLIPVFEAGESNRTKRNRFPIP